MSSKPETSRTAATSRPARKTRNASRSPARRKSPSRASAQQERRSPSRGRTRRNVASPTSPSQSTVTSPDFKGFERRPMRSTRITRSSGKEQEVKKSVVSLKSISLDSDSDNPDPIQEIKEKPKIAVRARTRQIDDGLKSPYDEESFETQLRKKLSNLARRSTRSSEPMDVERIVKYDKKLSEFSDEDDVSVKKDSLISEMTDDRFTEFGGAIGAFVLMILFPIYVLGLYVFCNENSCDFALGVNYKKYLQFNTYFNTKSCLIFIGYALFVAILSFIPFGGKKITGLPNKHGKLLYVMNGFFITVCLLLVCFALEFYEIPVFNYFIKNYTQFFLPSLLFGCAFSLLGYFRSFHIPLSALSWSSTVNSKVYNIFMGREINPRLFGILDLKIYFIRLSLIASVLLNIAYLHQTTKLSWTKANNPIDQRPSPETISAWFNVPSLLRTVDIRLNPTIAIICGQNLINLLERIVYESVWLSSFEVQYEGFGYMSTVGHTLYPFLSALPAKYVYEFGLDLPTWQLVASSAVFLFGFILFFKSNRVKDTFRRNPYDAKLKDLETLPTSQGRKLIVSGLWGIVRHPNHLGVILMRSALLPFIWNVPPVTIVAFTVCLLVHRCIRDNNHCRQKYGAAWDRYCQKVKYALIPKVY